MMYGAREHDDYHVHDGPQSPAKRQKNDEGSWRPWTSPSRGASVNAVHSSTPEKHAEPFHRSQTRQVAKQPTTPGHKRVYLGFIYDALGAKPQEPSSLEDILNWIRVNRLVKYREYGGQKLRTAIQMSLNFQAKKVESKRTIWAYSDGNSIGKWQLHKPVVTVTDDEEGVDTNTERHTRTPSMPGHSSGGGGGQTFDSASVSCEDTPSSEIRQTREQHHTISQNISHTIVPQTQAGSRSGFITDQISHPPPEAYARSEDGNPTLDGDQHSALKILANNNETLAQADTEAENTSMTINNEPSHTKDDRAPSSVCDESGKDCKNEPDFGQIVRDLRRLKQERQLQEQKIEVDQNSLPDVDILTQSASDAQRAADAAQRVADDARLTAETAKKAVEDAEVKHGQLAADKVDLAKLVQDSDELRAQLGID